VDIDRMLADRVGRDTDEVLATLLLVHKNDDLARRLADQLVDLLVEAMFIDLRRRFGSGELDRDEFSDEIAVLARQCRQAGLLPLRAPES
jgi:hypothetical protein